ncbi:hypothetical protein HDU86_007878 [Geranomyces michiganensis]|nr:hypothetical protein HDU86_007878 [Geranomyces michiganensis]
MLSGCDALSRNKVQDFYRAHPRKSFANTATADTAKADTAKAVAADAVCADAVTAAPASEAFPKVTPAKAKKVSFEEKHGFKIKRKPVDYL